MSSTDPVVQPNPRWIRGTAGGHTVVDTRSALYVWEVPYYPAWYVPLGDIDAELITNGLTGTSERLGERTRYDVTLPDGRTLSDAAARYLDAPTPELRGMVHLEWDALDSWFEEDEEVFVHPRSPFVRVDAISSRRHVRVSVDEELVADSTHPVTLFETGLPIRYYLPKADVRMDMLTPTDTTSACPYKGWAHYWSVTVGDAVHGDVAWGYRTPLRDAARVAGYVCFYDEKLDVEVDGVRQERPATKFS